MDVPEAMETSNAIDIQPTGSGRPGTTGDLVLTAGGPRLFFMRFWNGNWQLEQYCLTLDPPDDLHQSRTLTLECPDR